MDKEEFEQLANEFEQLKEKYQEQLYESLVQKREDGEFKGITEDDFQSILDFSITASDFFLNNRFDKLVYNKIEKDDFINDFVEGMIIGAIYYEWERIKRVLNLP